MLRGATRRWRTLWRSLPGPLQDPDSVYAVARHHRRAGDEVPAGAPPQRAGRRPARPGGHGAGPGRRLPRGRPGRRPAPATAVLHPLALAYLRASRYAEAGATIERALATEHDRRTRAHLLITEIELHHTLWDDEKALAATAAALTELGRPLPHKGVALLASTIAHRAGRGRRAAYPMGIRKSKGRRRDDLAALAATLDAGGYAAGVGLRLREAGVLAMRAMYAVNRLGPCPEYVRVYALIGYVAAVVKLRGPADALPRPRRFGRERARRPGAGGLRGVDARVRVAVRRLRRRQRLRGGHQPERALVRSGPAHSRPRDHRYPAAPARVRHGGAGRVRARAAPARRSALVRGTSFAMLW